MGAQVLDAHPVDVAGAGAAGQAEGQVQGTDLEAVAAQVASGEMAAHGHVAALLRRRSPGGSRPWRASPFVRMTVRMPR